MLRTLMLILAYSSACSAAFVITSTSAFSADYLTGDMLKAIAANGDYNGLVIEVSKDYPLSVDENGIGTGFTSSGAEIIFIFGDGEVFTYRFCFEGWVNEYYLGKYKVDETWRAENNPFNKVYIKKAKYNISPDEIGNILEILGGNKGELKTGETIMNHGFSEKARVTYKGYEGMLREETYTGIEGNDKTEIIEQLLELFRDTEWNKCIQTLDDVEYDRMLNEKKEEYGWFRPERVNRYDFLTLEAARKAHGLE